MYILLGHACAKYRFVIFSVLKLNCKPEEEDERLK